MVGYILSNPSEAVSFFDFAHLQAAQQGAEETARITSFTVNGLMSAISTG